MHLPVFGVHFDNWTAGYQSASHLVQAGYAGLWFLGPSDQPWAVDRLAGAKAAANGRGADIQPLLGDQTYGIWPNVTRIREQTIELLDGFNPSAGFGVVAANDTTAATVSAVLRERGLSAGVDYGLVGFDNSPDSRRNDITTFRPPLEELGTEASRILAVALSGDTRQQRIGLRGQLIARSSTSPYHSR